MIQIQFQIIKRCHSRSTYWTTKGLYKALTDIGANPFPHPTASMLLLVQEQFPTKEQAIIRRKQIDHALSTVSHKGRSPAYLFEVTNL